MLGFGILYQYDALPCLLGFYYLDQFLPLTSKDRSIVTRLHKATVFLEHDAEGGRPKEHESFAVLGMTGA